MLRFSRAVCSHAEWFALVSHTVTGYFKTENKKDEVIFTYNPLYETKLTNVFYHLCLWWSSSLLHLKLVNQQYTEFMPIYPKKGTKTWGHFLIGGSTERLEMLLVVQCMLTINCEFLFAINCFCSIIKGINVHLAKKMIEDRSRDYMNARRVAKVSSAQVEVCKRDKATGFLLKGLSLCWSSMHF